MRSSFIALVIVAAWANAGSAHPADDPREPAVIVAEFDSVVTPAFLGSRADEPSYVKDYEAQVRSGRERRAALGLELFKSKPDHPRATELICVRWLFLSRLGRADEAIEESGQHLSGRSALAQEAGFVHAQLLAQKHELEPEKALAAIDAFAKAWPTDDRAATQLSLTAASTRGARKVEVWTRILKDYPTSDEAARAPGQIRQVKDLGKPFELAFSDAVTGVEIDISKSKGTIFVIDFWATWCGPCVREMPKNKELYARYKDQGVQFIGISHDDPEHKGGKKALLKYVKDNDIRWPQYYQGNGRNSEFSMGWGVRAIPTVFVVDAEGNLYSTEARDELETMIPELIRRRDQAGAGAPGEGVK